MRGNLGDILKTGFVEFHILHAKVTHACDIYLIFMAWRYSINYHYILLSSACCMQNSEMSDGAAVYIYTTVDRCKTLSVSSKIKFTMHRLCKHHTKD